MTTPKKPTTSVPVFDVRATNASEIIAAIVQAKAVMKSDNPKIVGAFSGPVRVCVRKFADGTMKLCVGD